MPGSFQQSEGRENSNIKCIKANPVAIINRNHQRRDEIQEGFKEKKRNRSDNSATTRISPPIQLIESLAHGID